MGFGFRVKVVRCKVDRYQVRALKKMFVHGLPSAVGDPVQKVHGSVNHLFNKPMSKPASGA